jgi:co-chaperonin GroES (HSP10)
MKITPLFDRVLLKPAEDQVSASGIHIPRDRTERTQMMIVEAVGEGCRSDGMEPLLRPGDRVAVSKYAGTEIATDGGGKRFIMRQIDILARIEAEA